MKIEKVKLKCAICGEENEYEVIYSGNSFGDQDFDLKPKNNLTGTEIHECPNCHYCSPSIDMLLFEEMLHLTSKERIEKWNEFLFDIEHSLHIREIDISNKVLKKYLIMSEISDTILDNMNSYQYGLKTLWVAENLKLEKEVKLFRKDIINFYKSELLIDKVCGLLQHADLLRMNEDFNSAKCVIEGVEKILSTYDENDVEFLLSVVSLEKAFIDQKDSSRHSLTEVK